MGGFDHFQPLRRRQLIGTQRFAYRIVENLGGRPRQTSQALLAQQREIISERHAQRARPMPYLERQEGMDMHGGIGAFDSRHYLKVSLASEAWMNAPLQTDLRGATNARFGDTSTNFAHFEKVGLLRTRMFARTLGKRAKGTPIAA